MARGFIFSLRRVVAIGSTSAGWPNRNVSPAGGARMAMDKTLRDENTILPRAEFQLP
jgi:hypothetical protein